jgi:hydrogenase maturation protein HypF
MDSIEHAIPLPRPAKPVLAMGAWFKNTLCLTSGQQAFVSHNVGDLDTADACCAHERQAHALLGLGERPCAIAHDLHPDFHSTIFAGSLAGELNIPLIPVQHHHAHIAAVCAEHGVSSPVLGLALDGVGLGTDSTPWGGELLQVDAAAFQRMGHLRPLPLPGGDRAAREPWRMAAAVLHELGRGEEIAQRFSDQAAAATVADMLRRGFNCPRTSSMGRVFDAAAGLLGTCAKMQFEAQAAIDLEKLAQNHEPAAPLADGYSISQNFELDFFPLLAVLADCSDADYGAALFHATLAAGLADWVERATAENSIRAVALGGGCFLNNMLSQALESSLSAKGLRVLTARRLSPGDSAIALGQAWVAMHRLELEREN